jgi:hypothetical protein
MAGRRMIGTAYGLRRPGTSMGEQIALEQAALPKPRNNTDFIGVEIEIEGCELDHAQAGRRLGVHQSGAAGLIPVWTVKRDGSLRNNGLEFVTVPIHVSSLETVLTQLYAYLHRVYPECDFSERCGIHIHADCTNLSAAQLLDFIKLYIIFENPIFNFIGEERKGSNFCVPLHNFSPAGWFHYTELRNERILHHIPHQETAKYSALNPCRLVDLGTLEFRHLEGTWDVQRIVTFASIIQRMKFFAMGTRNDQRIQEFISTANTISNFDQFAREVFTPQYFNHIIPNGYDLKEIEAGVSQAKKFVLGLTNEDHIPSTMILDIFGNEAVAKRIRKFMDRGNGRTPAIRRNEDEDGNELDGEAEEADIGERPISITQAGQRARQRRGTFQEMYGNWATTNFNIATDREVTIVPRTPQEGEEQ